MRYLVKCVSGREFLIEGEDWEDARRRFVRAETTGKLIQYDHPERTHETFSTIALYVEAAQVALVDNGNGKFS